MNTSARHGPGLERKKNCIGSGNGWLRYGGWNYYQREREKGGEVERENRERREQERRSKGKKEEEEKHDGGGGGRNARRGKSLLSLENFYQASLIFFLSPIASSAPLSLSSPC